MLVNTMKVWCFLVAVQPAASTCSPNCLNSTESSAGPTCNETRGECLSGCVLGYAGPLCLVPCGGNCANCSISPGTSSETICNQCEHNHFKNDSHCEPCSDNCQSNSSYTGYLCRQEDGYCELGCKKNFHGEMCDLNCSSNCLTNVESEFSSCDRDGTCILGCKDKYYGPTCDYRCDNKCEQELCQRDGVCSVGCRFPFLGGPR